MDSGNGIPSPVMSDPKGQKRFLPIPIPYPVSQIPYSRVFLHDKLTASTFLKDVGQDALAKRCCHVDPDLRRGALHQRSEDWIPGFGQVAQSQSHLKNQGVEAGDLFLFFGWFQYAVHNGDRCDYVKHVEHPDGFHAIYGYLQVGEVHQVVDGSYPSGLKNHPHILHQKADQFKKENNTVYSAQDRLSEFAIDAPGCGYFAFDKKLILTAPDQKYRTTWQLPMNIHPDEGVELTYHRDPKRWKRESGASILRSAIRGQEFVFRSDPNGFVKDWAERLFEIALPGDRLIQTG